MFLDKKIRILFINLRFLKNKFVLDWELSDKVDAFGFLLILSLSHTNSVKTLSSELHKLYKLFVLPWLELILKASIVLVFIKSPLTDFLKFRVQLWIFTPLSYWAFTYRLIFLYFFFISLFAFLLLWYWMAGLTASILIVSGYCSQLVVWEFRPNKILPLIR